MAYDRYDTRNERGRWANDRTGERGRFRDENYGRAGGPPRGDHDRGFFERAGDEIASWFGDDDAERRRDRDRRFEERGYGPSRFGRDDDRGRDWDRGRDEDGSFLSSGGYRGHGGSTSGFRDRSRQGDLGHAPGFEGGSQPMFGGYTAAESLG